MLLLLICNIGTMMSAHLANHEHNATLAFAFLPVLVHSQPPLLVIVHHGGSAILCGGMLAACGSEAAAL